MRPALGSIANWGVYCLALLNFGLCLLWWALFVPALSFGWSTRPSWHSWLIFVGYILLPTILAAGLSLAAVLNASEGRKKLAFLQLAFPLVAFILCGIGIITGFLM